jgi:hypothetical protein
VFAQATFHLVQKDAQHCTLQVSILLQEVARQRRVFNKLMRIKPISAVSGKIRPPC